MAQNLVGLKIRTLRKDRGLTQRELAKNAGISASYLNLVELNKRAAGRVLLERIAAGLDVEPALLDGEAERRLAVTLSEIAADPALIGVMPRHGSAEELVSRHPGWVNLIVKLYQSWHDERQAVLALADRLNRDPFLGDSVHRMLSSVTAIRSATEILQSAEGVDDSDRQRFMSIIEWDSERLSDTARSLVAFFDNANMRVRSATPMEHVDAFIFETDNHFPELEALTADALATSLKGATPEAAAHNLIGDDVAAVDPMMSPETQRFQIMRQVARKLASDSIEALVAGHPALGSDDARQLAASALVSYAAAAFLMPYERFLEAAEKHRYDLDTLCRLFGVSYEQAAHRLATLRRPGAEGVYFAFMRSDRSGYVTKRLPLSRLPLPRYGTACPIWPIYAAFGRPGTTVRSFGELPSGDEFLFFARAVDKQLPAPNLPRHLLSVMLACPAEHADRLVYADGIERRKATLSVGTVCRLCPRVGCGHRQEAQLIA